MEYFSLSSGSFFLRRKMEDIPENNTDAPFFHVEKQDFGASSNKSVDFLVIILYDMWVKEAI